jgi:hypothetical protein
MPTSSYNVQKSPDLHLYYRAGNSAEILAIINARTTTRKDDTAYALTGILSVHLTLAYGEGLESPERLLYELAIQKGDLSFCVSLLEKRDLECTYQL